MKKFVIVTGLLACCTPALAQTTVPPNTTVTTTRAVEHDRDFPWGLIGLLGLGGLGGLLGRRPETYDGTKRRVP